MNIFQFGIMCLGRVLLSSIFLISAVHEMLDWGSTEQYVLVSVTRWMNTFQADEFMANILSSIFPWTPWILLIAIVLKLVGSVLLACGISVRTGAFLLVLFLVPVSLIVHCFWALPIEDRPLEMVMFIKNMSILGGLLIVLAFGKGKISLKSE